MRCLGSSLGLAATCWLLALAGCGPKQESARDSAANLPPVQVRAQLVEIKPRIMTEEVVGTLRAKLRATLEARLSGRIEALPVAMARGVHKGQLTARLDAAEIAARFEQAQASLEQAEHDWKRVSALFDEQTVARAEYDTAQSRRQIAKAALAEAKAMMGYVEILAPV